MGTVLLLLMSSYVPLGIHGLIVFFGLSQPVCLIPHSHGLFTNFIGLPRPNNLILILGVHGPAMNFGLAAALSRFVGPVIHYSYRLGLMVFCYLLCQFFVALIIGLSFCLPGLSQMALNIYIYII